MWLQHPAIYSRFAKLGCFTMNINNHPIVDELHEEDGGRSRRNNTVCYVGMIDIRRGIVEMMKASELANVELLLAGEFSPITLRQKIMKMKAWSQVKELGKISRKDVARLLSQAQTGLILFHPGPNYTDSQPNKIFEYMSAGIPVIASNFPLWTEIIEKNECGICVDPFNIGEIALAINRIKENPLEAKRMGDNGLKAVKEKYNWELESEKLISLYRILSQ